MCQPSSCRELNRITELACSGMAPVIVLVVLSKHIGDDAQAPSSTEVGRSIVLLTTQQPILPVVDSHYGHNKSRAILPYRELPSPPTLFFFHRGQ